MRTPIYLDYNATAPLRAEVMDTIQNAYNAPYNASSVHQFGQKGRSILENARNQIANLIGAPATQIIFNSGATEGNNTILHHFATSYPGETILVSAIEHPSILQSGVNVTTIPVTNTGIIDLTALEKLLKENKTSLVSTMFVNNETGCIQPIKDIADLAHKHGALLHVDGAQAAGRTNINMQKLGIDFLTLSSHKIGGPQGVGALALGLCGIAPTFIHGGGQEKSLRAGTENIAGIAGFGKAAAIAKDNIEAYQHHTRALQSKIENALSELPNINIHSATVPRVTNTTMFSIDSIPSETLMMALDLDGIAVSNGSACSSGKVEPSHVLLAMGETNTTASSAIRVSTGWNTTTEEIDYFLEKFNTVYKRLTA